MTGKTLARWVSGLLLACFACAPAAQADFVVRGTLKCAIPGEPERRPLAGVQVELWEDNYANSKISTTYADAKGYYRFPVNTDSKYHSLDNGDDVYISINLTDKSRAVEVYRFADAYAGPDNMDTDSTQASNKETVTINRNWVGQYSFYAPACAQWLGARAAQADFRAITGTTFPYDVTVGYPNNDVPYTNYDETKWPTGYQTNQHGTMDKFDVSFHEFAHAFRARLDGDEGHFVNDVFAYGYIAHHSLCKNSNPGFAFNEGWAAFMARVTKKDGCGNGEMTYEGNVANRLDRFSRACASRKQMIDVLRQYKRQIHNIDGYEVALEKLVPACSAVPRGAPVAEASQQEPVLDEDHALPPEEVEKRATEDIAQLMKQAEALRAAAKEATTTAQDPPRCRSARACADVAEIVAAPTVLDAQAKAAEAAAKLVSDELAAGKAMGFTPTPESEAAQDARVRDYYAATGTLLADAAKTARSKLSGSVKGRGKPYFGAAKSLAQQFAVQGRTRPGLRPLPPIVLPRLSGSDRLGS